MTEIVGVKADIARLAGEHKAWCKRSFSRHIRLRIWREKDRMRGGTLRDEGAAPPPVPLPMGEGTVLRPYHPLAKPRNSA